MHSYRNAPLVVTVVAFFLMGCGSHAQKEKPASSTAAAGEQSATGNDSNDAGRTGKDGDGLGLPSPSESKLDYIRRIDRDVTSETNLNEFLRKNPSARITLENRAEGMKELQWGDGFFKRHVVFLDGKMVHSAAYVFRASYEDAMAAVKEMEVKLGEIHSSEIPAERKHEHVLWYVWDIPEMDWSVGTSILTGSTKDGIPVYYFGKLVTNTGAIKRKMASQRR